MGLAHAHSAFSHLASAEQIARVRLIRSENVGPISFRHLLARFGSARTALDAVPELARKGGGKRIRIAPASVAEAEIQATRAAGGELLFLGVPPYPSLLAHVEDAPPVLAARGHIPLADRPAVALVGARNASLAGQTFALRLARELAEAGLVVVSGLARGIDTAAHKGALAASGMAGNGMTGNGMTGGYEGGTVGVVAGGLNVFYPPENELLQKTISEQGLLLSEQPWGAIPQQSHFPRRNRIISGLSLGLVVVEATARSGSLISARLAGEQGRLVMAVPGSPLEPRAHGPNGLIRDGATLVQCCADVLEALGPQLRLDIAAPEVPFAPALVEYDADDAARRAVVELLGTVPVGVDDVIRATGLPPAVVAIVLLELELAGRILRHGGHRISLVPDA